MDDLHSAGSNLNKETASTERGKMIAGFGMTPNWHDALTGSPPDGRAFPAQPEPDLQQLDERHFRLDDARPYRPHAGPNSGSWNSAHMSRSCSQPDLIATGGNGLFYCFAVQ